jgi:hypothetical protein
MFLKWFDGNYVYYYKKHNNNYIYCCEEHSWTLHIIFIIFSSTLHTMFIIFSWWEYHQGIFFDINYILPYITLHLNVYLCKIEKGSIKWMWSIHFIIWYHYCAQRDGWWKRPILTNSHVTWDFVGMDQIQVYKKH